MSLDRAAPEIAVIVPAYNSSRTLETTLGSVAGQTFRDLRVTVVDDGSTDETADKAKSLLGRLNLPGEVLRQPNRGQGAARNRGVAHNTAPLVAFLDADDIWYPNKLERMVEFVRTQPPDVGLICHYERVVDERGRQARINRYGPESATRYRKLLLDGNTRLSPSAVLVRREVLVAVHGFSEDPSHRSVEDYDLWLRLSKITRFAFLPEVLGEYHLVPGSSSANVQSHLQATLDVLDSHFATFAGASVRERWLWRVRARRRRQVVYRQAARKYLELGERQAAGASLARAMGLYPLAPKAWALLAMFMLGRRQTGMDAPRGEKPKSVERWTS